MGVVYDTPEFGNTLALAATSDKEEYSSNRCVSAYGVLAQRVSRTPGPIDAQISWQGKVFSVDALIGGMEKIKMEVVKT